MTVRKEDTRRGSGGRGAKHIPERTLGEKKRKGRKIRGREVEQRGKMMEYEKNGRWFLLMVMIGQSVGVGANAASDNV